MKRATKAQARGTFMVLLGGAITITIFTILIIYAMRSGQESYSTLQFNDTQFSNFNKTEDVVTLTSQMNDAFTSLNGSSTGALDAVQATTTGGYNTLRILGSIPSVYAGMMYGAAAILGIPIIIVQLITFIIIGFIIALFILLVFRVYVA